MFRGLISSSRDVYMEDLLVKSMEEADHLTHLAKVFHILRSYRMKLNPSKCAFSVSSRKFLGHLISRRGIEANPKNIQAIIRMRSPRMIKEVRSLVGRVVALT